MLDTKQDEVSIEDLIDQFVVFYFAGTLFDIDNIL